MARGSDEEKRREEGGIIIMMLWRPICNLNAHMLTHWGKKKEGEHLNVKGWGKTLHALMEVICRVEFLYLHKTGLSTHCMSERIWALRNEEKSRSAIRSETMQSS